MTLLCHACKFVLLYLGYNYDVHTVLSAPKVCDEHKNSEYDQEIPQLQTADNPMAPRGRAKSANYSIHAVR